MSKLIVLQCVRLEDKEASFTRLNVHQTEILENVFKKNQLSFLIMTTDYDYKNLLLSYNFVHANLQNLMCKMLSMFFNTLQAPYISL